MSQTQSPGSTPDAGSGATSDPTSDEAVDPPRLSPRGGVVLGLLGLAAVAVLVLAGNLGWPSGVRIATAAALVVAALFLLSARDLAAVQGLLEVLLSGLAMVLGFVFVLVAPVLVLGVVRAVPEIGFSPLRYLALVVTTAALVVIIAYVWRDDGGLVRGANFFTGLWVYCGTVAAIAVGVFTAVTWEFYRHSLVTFDEKPTGPGQLADFYVYHLVNALPFDVTGAFHLNPPLEYHQARMGWVILTFTAVVVGAVVHYARKQFQVRHQEQAGAQQQ